MKTQHISIAGLCAALLLGACESNGEATGGTTATDAQNAYEAFEQRLQTAANQGDEAARALIRVERPALETMATQDCPQAAGTLAELDCQYDAAGAAYLLSYVTSFDAEPAAADALNPYAVATARADAATSSCQAVSESAGRCAIAREVATLTPVLAELRDVRIAAKDTSVRSVESWDGLKNSLFRVSETVGANWTAPGDLPETAFIKDGRTGVACGVVEALNTISFSRDQNVFDANGNEQLSEAQKIAYGGFFQQRDAAMLALAGAIVPDAAGTDSQKREALLLACVPTNEAS